MIERHRDYPYPSGDDWKEYAKSLHGALTEEARERVRDFDMHKINNVPWIDAGKYGASPYATAAENDAAIAASIADLSDGGHWLLPPGDYDISSVVAFSTLNECTMDFRGRLMAQSCSGVSFNAVDRCRIDGINVVLETGDTWDGAYDGVSVKDFMNNEIHIRRVSDFGKALVLDGDASGISYNRFSFGLLHNSKYGLHISSTNAGWVKDNNFYGGSIRLDGAVKAANAGSWAVFFAATPANQFDNARFYGIAIENQHNGIQFNSCVNMTLITPRFEGVDANWVSGGEWVLNLVWTVGADVFDETMVDFDAQCKGLVILGAEYGGTGYRPIMTDMQNGGITFISRHSISDTLAHLYVRSFDAMGLRFDDIWGESQYLNTSYKGAAEPTTGTYSKNAVVWNTSVAGGFPIGWVCSVSGTADTLAGVTGGITNGTKLLVVNSATDLLEGMYITIAGVTGTKQIHYIDGTNVYIYVNADATVAGAAVAYSAPTWVTMANHMPVWDDLRVPISSVKRLGNTDPDWEQFQDDGAASTGVYALAFATNVDQEVYFSCQLPHSYDEGTDIIPHVHWSPSDTGAGNVTWKLEYTWANIDGTFGTTSTATVTAATDTVALKHQRDDLTTITGTSKTISSMLMCRLYRDVSDGDTYASDAFLLEIDFHYQLDTTGSSSVSAK